MWVQPFLLDRVPASLKNLTDQRQSVAPIPLPLQCRIVFGPCVRKLGAIPRELHLLLLRPSPAVRNRHLLRGYLAILLSPSSAHQPVAVQ